MARTPMIQALREIARDWRTADALGVSVAEVVDQRAETAASRPPGFTRRAFLAGAAATAAAGALGFAKGSGPQPRIAIVGAGIAGLTAALELADAGYASTVYEASALRVGGRMMSSGARRGNHGEGGGCDRCHGLSSTCRACHSAGFPPAALPTVPSCGTCHSTRQPFLDPDTVPGYWADDQVVEVYGELIDTHHVVMRHLAQRFRLDLVPLLAAQPPHAEETYWFFDGYYTREEARRDFQAVHRALQRDVQGAGYPTTWDSSTPEGRALDAMTAYDWIETRIEGGHASPMGKLLDVAYNIEYGAETTDQTALNLVYLLGYNARPGNFLTFGQSDERFHVAGGNDQLPRAIAEHLGVGAAVKLGWRLEALAQESDGTYTLDFAQDVGHHQDVARSVRADIVLLAFPFAVLRDLDLARAAFDALKVRTILELGRGVNGKGHVQFSRRLWNEPGPWGVSSGSTFGDTGFQATWEATRGQPGEHGILVHYTGGDVTLAQNLGRQIYAEGGPYAAALGQQFLTQIEPMFPGISPLWNGRASYSLAHNHPFYKSSYCYWRVGQMQIMAGYERVRQGNVFFAGEHTSLDNQGFMEGGASEGVRAAREILADLKR